MAVVLIISSLSLNASAASVSNNLDDILFDADFYYSLYPDLQRTIGYNPTLLRQHYLTYGKKEGRSPSSLFDPKFYLNKYWDLKAAFGDNYISVYDHFLKYGIKEGRQGSALFNVQTYKNNYADLRNAFGTDSSNNWKYLKHWREYGSAEKRNAITTITTNNVANVSSSLVDSNLSKISYIKQGSDTCKASSVAMALNLVTGKNTYTTASMGGSLCIGINGNKYMGSDGRTYVSTYKTDGYVGSATEQTNAINAALSAGLPIVVAVHSTRSGYTKHHWVVVVGRSGNDYLVVDPASGSSGSMASNVKAMSSLHYAFGLADYNNGLHFGYVSFSRA